MAHIHIDSIIVDDDPHFSVDPTTREITSLSPDKLVFVQGDHNSERVTFVVPRYIDGHDMRDCEPPQVHYLNISAKDRNTRSSGVYECDDVRVNPEDEFSVIFSWLVSRGATLHTGSLSFILRFACVEDINIIYSWSTAVYSDISILETINNSVAVTEEYTDILKSWYNEIVGAETRGVKRIEDLTDESLREISELEETVKDNALNGIGEEFAILYDVNVPADIDDMVAAATSEINNTRVEAVEDIERIRGLSLDSLDENKAAALDEIRDAGATQKAAVESAGATQKSAVEKAGATQKEDIITTANNLVRALEGHTDILKSDLNKTSSNLINNLNNTEVKMSTNANYVIGSSFNINMGGIPADVAVYVKRIAVRYRTNNGTYKTRTIIEDGYIRTDAGVNELRDFAVGYPITFEFNNSLTDAHILKFQVISRFGVEANALSVGSYTIGPGVTKNYTIHPILPSGGFIGFGDWYLSG